jgi:hypothetical protein
MQILDRCTISRAKAPPVALTDSLRDESEPPNTFLVQQRDSSDSKKLVLTLKYDHTLVRGSAKKVDLRADYHTGTLVRREYQCRFDRERKLWTFYPAISMVFAAFGRIVLGRRPR